MTFVFQLLTGCVSAIIVSIAANYLALVPAVAIIILLLILRWYFLKTSIVIRRLEAVG